MSNIPLGADNDSSAPFNEVEYEVSAEIIVSKRVFFKFHSGPNESEQDLEDCAYIHLKNEYGDSLLEVDELKIRKI